MSLPDRLSSRLEQRQIAEFSARIGNVGVRATTDMTTGGLLGTGAMVAGVLLSTALLVGVAIREARRLPIE
ncbi:hypothetical protein ASG67_09890 [Sphingomonas sp. Leaf339]|uniref:hypothetical protein n=1 Tax=Sphingomonas sp. Leaf339 TaxID=1736343 RepID=UPI000701CD94|nr:hypothetical protein [Sphingomonas sp. Leaf339]KQU53131.1 hypothetical protein ASG67_09890 [Sphingomonas sp. Leaf339]